MPGQSQARGGREAQKARTREALVQAARTLERPSVGAAADAAGISRATAYRYFPTQDALDVELDRDVYWRDVERLVHSTASLEVGARINRLIDAIVARVSSDERHVRKALRLYHDNWLRDPAVPGRRGGRMEWIDALIAPLPATVRRKLRLPLALAIGPDQVTMLHDVARLEPKEIARVLKWSAAAMLKAAED
jgi:AcrR family transcriptional regulator